MLDFIQTAPLEGLIRKSRPASCELWGARRRRPENTRIDGHSRRLRRRFSAALSATLNYRHTKVDQPLFLNY